jgi:hypothetical protein
MTGHRVPSGGDRRSPEPSVFADAGTPRHTRGGRCPRRPPSVLSTACSTPTGWRFESSSAHEKALHSGAFALLGLSVGQRFQSLATSPGTSAAPHSHALCGARSSRSLRSGVAPRRLPRRSPPLTRTASHCVAAEAGRRCTRSRRSRNAPGLFLIVGMPRGVALRRATSRAGTSSPGQTGRSRLRQTTQGRGGSRRYSLCKAITTV